MAWGEQNGNGGGSRPEFEHFRRPAPQPPGGGPRGPGFFAKAAAVIGVAIAAAAVSVSTGIPWGALCLGAVVAWVAYGHWQRNGGQFGARPASDGSEWTTWTDTVLNGHDLLAGIQLGSMYGHGAYLGMTGGNGVFAEPEQGVLVIGPPRSGKTTGLVMPMLLAHTGPAVVTSTKDEVARQCAMARYRTGRVYIFDPSGEVDPTMLAPQIELLRWSPLQSARRSWYESQKMAKAMTESSVSRAGSGVENASYWGKRAGQLLAALLYAATRPQPDVQTAGRDGVETTQPRPYDMGDVVEWVTMSQMVPPQEALIAAASRGDEDAKRALQALTSVLDAPERERGSVITTAFTAIEAYNSSPAIRASTDPTFDAAVFVESDDDTIFITAGSEDQASMAPLVVGLLQDVRRATFARGRYQRGSGDTYRRPVLFLLDEVANIAPIPDLPQLITEAGGQGLRIVAILQALPQAAERWGKEAANSFLSTFGALVVFGGTKDRETLETLSTLLGTETRYMPSVGNTVGPGGSGSNKSWTPQTFPVATPAEISQIPPGFLLVFDGKGHSFVGLTKVHEHTPWVQVLQWVHSRGWEKTIDVRDDLVLEKARRKVEEQKATRDSPGKTRPDPGDVPLFQRFDPK